MTTLPRCTHPGCPIRWHNPPDRPCAEHGNEALRAARELGISLDRMAYPPPGDGGMWDGDGEHPPMEGPWQHQPAPPPQ